ncbi:MAG: nickel pincer cofactor biosynthesis protein LarC, partial [Acidimicrobiales bacterium]
MAVRAWFHCFAGIAGDMALASLVDAGADLDEVRDLLDRLPLGGYRLTAEAVLRGGIAATRVIVAVDDEAIVRTYQHIVALVEEGRLPDRVRDRAVRTFAALAEAEGRLHRRPPSQIHFHEVGGLDAIVDIVGTCAALELLGVDEVHASPVATGTGVVRTAHGVLPNPAPAVVELLKGAPVYGRPLNVELTTPTGAALLAANVVGWGPLPAMEVHTTGFGAGTREIDDLPNLTQVVLGTATDRPDPTGPAAHPAVELSVNVDDATGEALAHAVQALLATGAYDAWVTPVVMKRGRPAFMVSALADPALAAEVAGVLALETGSLGVR